MDVQYVVSGRKSINAEQVQDEIKMVLDAFQKDTLLKAEKIFLKLNSIDLYRKSYNLQQLEIHNGFTRISVNEEGIPNYQIWHSQSDSFQVKSLDLNHVSLTNIHIKYSDTKSNLYISTLASQTELKGTIENSIFSAQINGDFETDFIKVSQDKYLEEKKLSTWVSLDASIQHSSFNGSVQTNDLELKFNGAVQNGYAINVIGSKIDINTILDYVPKQFLSSIQSYQFDGIADLNINLENQKKTKLPVTIHADFNIENGSIQSNFPWQIKDVEIKGIYNNGKLKTNESSIISLQSFKCQLNGEYLKGSLTYSNFNNPNIQTQLNIELDLADIQRWGYELPIQEVSGRAKITAQHTITAKRTRASGSCSPPGASPRYLRTSSTPTAFAPPPPHIPATTASELHGLLCPNREAGLSS